MSKIDIKDLNLFYGDFQALINVNMSIKEKCITALIGSSGCGKSTLLRCINRMNDLIEGVKITGLCMVDGQNIYAEGLDLVKLRKRIGMVFQRPNPFPLSIYENIAFGPRIHHMAKGSELDSVVEESLKSVLLWDELKDKLSSRGFETHGYKSELCSDWRAPAAPVRLVNRRPRREDGWRSYGAKREGSPPWLSPPVLCIPRR